KFLKSKYANGPANLPHGVGASALIGLALLEAGEPTTDPAIKEITKEVREASYSATNTYPVTLCLLYLDRHGDPADVPLIHMLGVRLLAGQNGQGGWGYVLVNNVPEDQVAKLKAGLRGPPPPNALHPE